MKNFGCVIVGAAAFSVVQSIVFGGGLDGLAPSMTAPLWMMLAVFAGVALTPWCVAQLAMEAEVAAVRRSSRARRRAAIEAPVNHGRMTDALVSPA